MFSRYARYAFAAATVAALAGGVAAAQPPPITNARLTSQPAGDLDDTFRTLLNASVEPRWIGYLVPAVDGDRRLCCTNGARASAGSTDACCGACRLEPDSQAAAADRAPGASTPVPLEAGTDLAVMVRLSDRRTDRVAIFSETCELDAGGLPVVWLENVRPEASLALLESLIGGDSPRRVMHGAIAAIALHRGEAADASLDRLVSPGQPEAVRRAVPFWLGEARGARGLAALQRILREDASPRVREAAVFGVSQSSAPGALDALIATARTHDQPQVRARAIFWLGQKAGAKAASTIAERVEADPDTEVKKRAVFALSQLPKDEGVPLLIEVARTNRNVEVRKQAMFWLAQSGDPRAIDFFASILK